MWFSSIRSLRAPRIFKDSEELRPPLSQVATSITLIVPRPEVKRHSSRAGNRAVKLGEYYVLVKTQCVRNRALIAKGLACIAKVVARKKGSKTWRFSVAS
jgi:hypothetical protein